MIGLVSEISNLTAGEPSISLLVNQFSVLVTWSLNLIMLVALEGTRPIK